jgi:hypothetical protein
VFVFFGRNVTHWPSTPTTVFAADYANASFIGEFINDYAGFSVSGAGDVNGDGYNDILIGAADERGKGKAYVIFGRAYGWVMDQSLSQANLIFRNNNPHEFFAFDVSGLGDINEDGYADFSISTPFANDLKGKIFVIFGGTAWSPTPAWLAIILILSLIIILILSLIAVFTFRKRMK